jgi:hypothetical protein
MMPPAPSQAPLSPPMPPGAMQPYPVAPPVMMPAPSGPVVDLRANDLAATLYQFRGERIRTYWGRRGRYSYYVEQWDPVCRMPCGREVDPGGVYSIRGMRINPSRSSLKTA